MFVRAGENSSRSKYSSALGRSQPEVEAINTAIKEHQTHSCSFHDA